jgi:acyl carrier protein
MTTYTPDDVLQDLQPIFQEALNMPSLIVARASSALNTANWDSLAHISIIEMVESRFKIRIGLSELEDLKAVGDLIDLIVEKAS